MNKDKLVDWMFTYGWAILVILVAVGALFFFGVFKPTEKFNPELHDCIEWEVDTSKCDLSSLLFSGLSIETGNMSNGEKVRLVVCHYGFVPDRQGESYTTAKQEFEDKCVAWQPKKALTRAIDSVEKAKTEAELYCVVNPSDANKCMCVQSSDNVLVPTNETRIILPEGTTNLPSGFMGGGCAYGKGFKTSCIAHNFTKKQGCVEAVPK